MIVNVEKSINNFSELVKIINNISDTDIHVKNKFLSKLFNLILDIDNKENKLEIFYHILRENINKLAFTTIAGLLVVYEPNIAKKIYKLFKDKDGMSSLLLENWDTDLKSILSDNQIKINNYNKRKEKNIKKYKEMIEKYNNFLKKLEKGEISI